MTKFAKGGPVRTVPAETPTGVTWEGGPAFSRDPKSELFLLAVTNMVAETTFYEAAAERDARFVGLIHQVTKTDPEWVARFIPWLRREAHMRSASTQAAAEYVLAGGPNGRAVIREAMARADEPAEMVAYAVARRGTKSLPKALQRGVADWLTQNLDEFQAMKYDGTGREWRLGDVIELTHPKPKDSKQAALFKYLLDRRHHPEDRFRVSVEGRKLTRVADRERLRRTPEAERREMIRSSQGQRMISHSGMTWEELSSWLPGGMDAEAWEAIMPEMGYMALLWNLRNFDQAGLSDEKAGYVAARLADPAQVARSRQFPFRFWTAYKTVPSTRWTTALTEALQHSVSNIPGFDGRTLILTDTSSSMTMGVSTRSVVTHAEIAAVFASSMGHRCSGEVEFISFAGRGGFWGSRGEDVGGWERLNDRGWTPTMPVLRSVDLVNSRIGAVGHGTELLPPLEGAYRGQDRVVIFSDMQVADAAFGFRFDPATKVYVFNTGGYRNTPIRTDQPNRLELGGFSDKAFVMMNMLEQTGESEWPF